MRRALLVVVTHGLPVLGLLLSASLYRPAWLRSAEFLAKRPKAQFWTLYAESAIFFPLAGVLIFTGLVTHAIALYRSPLMRTRAAWVWLAVLVLASAYIVIPAVSWSSNLLSFVFPRNAPQ